MAIINKRYNIVSILGKGGFGEVYKIEDTYENNKILAMKKIRSSVLTERSVNIFKYEFKFLTSLNHPNLVKVYDFNIDKESDELFFTMEYIEGRTLFQACQDKINWNIIEEYLVQSARALAYIHAKEIIHYDIKPDNIMIDKNNHLKLMDFGFAGTKEDSRVRGTIQFMAPDFLLKVPITNKIDFYSLGASFYYCITGKLPFTGCTKEEMLKNCARGEYTPISELVPDIPEHLAVVITKLMQKDFHHRYDCATEIISDINHFTRKSYKLFTENGIRAYIKSGKLFGRKKELEQLNDYAYKVLEQENFYDNIPIVLSGKDGHGKKAVLREFRYLIQLKEDIDYFTANFFVADENIYQAFEVVVEEMIRLYGINKSDCQAISFLFNEDKKLEEQNEIKIFTDESDRQTQISAICSFLAEVAAHHSFVMDLRNFNNASSASILLMENLIRTIRKFPEKEIKIVLIISIQTDKLPAYHKVFLDKILPDISVIEIGEFDFIQADEYIRELLMVKEFPESYTQTILKFTNGIPYYINELFIYLFSMEILDRDTGSWVLDDDFSIKINKTNQEIVFYNYQLFSRLEQLIIKEFFILERPVTYDLLGIIELLTDNSRVEIDSALHHLCNKDIIEKIKYSDGYHYYLGNDLFLEAVKEDFSTQEYIKLNRTSADFIKAKFGINSKTIYALADYYYRSREKEKTPAILKTAINKGFEDKNYEQSLIYMEKLLNIEENITNQQNVFIAILNTLEMLHQYQTALQRIGDFFKSYSNITVHNLLEINLKKYQCSLKLAVNKPLQESVDWFLREASNFKFNLDDKAKYYLWLGKFYKNYGDYLSSLSYLKKARKYYLNLEKRLSAAEVSLEIAQVLPQVGKLLKVQKILLECLVVFEEYQEYPKIIQVYKLLGDNYSDFDHDQKALEYYQECLKLAKSRNDLKHEIVAEIKIAKLKMQSLLVNESLGLLNKNIPILDSIDDYELTADIYYEISEVYYLNGRIVEAERQIDRCIEINIRLNKNVAMIKAYLLKMQILVLNSDFSQINILLNLIEKIIHKNDYINFGKYYFLTGVVVNNMDKQQGLKCFKKSLKYTFKPISLNAIIDFELQKSFIEEFLNKPKSALKYTKIAYDIYLENQEQLNDNRLIKIKLEILYNRQRAYLGEHEEAISGFSKLITLLESYDISLEKGRAKFYLGKIYYDIGDSSKAAYFFEAARNEFNKISINVKELAEINRLLPDRNLLNRTVSYE